MSPFRGTCRLIFALAVGLTVVQAQGKLTGSVEERIRRQALEGSHVQEYLFQLTDALGPRNTGSPALRSAREWLSSRLTQNGLRNVRREQNPPMEVGPGISWNPRGWSWSRLVVHQVTPWPATLTAVPVLYSPATNGVVVGETIFAPLPPPDEKALAAFTEQYRGRLRGRFVLLEDRERALPADERKLYHRYSESDMTEFESWQPPEVITTPKPPTRQPDPEQATRPPAGGEPSIADTLKTQSRLFRFLKEEGVLGLIGPAAGEGGTLALRPPATPPDLVELPPATFELAPEHFNRIVRLMKHGVPVELEVELRSAFSDAAGTENLLAEIPGTDRRDELVLVGAHLDSWHGGTGATDNATGVAVLLEAARILASANAPLRRTVRFAFWDGHELGLLGSRGYAAAHLIDPATGDRKPEYDKVSCYFNLDYGGGRIRGVYLQARAELKPILDLWLQGIGPGRLIATTRSTLGSDQATFERIGIPGFSFIQDPLNYEVRTHHTNMDLPDYVPVDDLKHSAYVLARLLYRAATSEELLPRGGAR